MDNVNQHTDLFIYVKRESIFYMKTVAVVLAAGSGSRMKSQTKKQFISILDKPLIYYSISAFERSFIDEIVIVTGEDDIEYVKNEIVKKYDFKKVTAVTAGGRERYHSVMNGINAVNGCDYIFIHDGARPMLDEAILDRALNKVISTGAAVVGMPAKDTVKIADENEMVDITPNRNSVWTIQTPQVFEFELIKKAYSDVISREEELKADGINITDDSMVLEVSTSHKVALVEGSYENIKVTTPEDIILAETFLKNRNSYVNQECGKV